MLVYDRWGRFGRPVLLLHGLLFDRTMWWPAGAELAGACSVIAPDLPGHGASPARAEHRVEDVARGLAGLVNSLDLHRAPIVVGHATSAPLAVAFADAYATHAVLTVDEPAAAVTGVDEVIAAAHLGDVPEHYRPYLVPRPDAALLSAYESWLAQPPARRTAPSLLAAGRAASRPEADGRCAHLVDPEGFAATLRDLL